MCDTLCHAACTAGSCFAARNVMYMLYLHCIHRTVVTMYNSDNRVKVAKNDWRGKLCDAHLSDQLMIMLESTDVLQFDPLPAIHVWHSTPRRLTEEQKTPGPSSVSLIPTRVTNEETSRASTSSSVLPDHNLDDDNENNYDFESGEEEDNANEREDAYRDICELLEDY